MPPFELVSDFAAAGDQPAAIDALAAGLDRGDRRQTLLGITGSGKSFTIIPSGNNTFNNNGTLAAINGSTMTISAPNWSNSGTMNVNNSSLNLNFNWERIAGSPLDLAVFATNVTNRKYPVNTAGGFEAFGFTALYYGQPRMYGVRVRYGFGQ